MCEMEWCLRVSKCFVVYVRVGGILSPILFNIYVNDLIDSLRATSVGFSISNVFMGCIMYADDLILISPTAGGLQSILTVCTDYGHSFDIVFNAKKCIFMCVGKLYTPAGISVFIDNVALTKVTFLNTWVLVSLQIENRMLTCRI